MPSTIMSTLGCPPSLREFGNSEGDVSYELDSLQSTSDSLSAGSAVSADSFVYIRGSHGYIGDDFDEQDDFVDPYLANNRRISHYRKNPSISPVRTLITAAMDDDDDSTTIDDGGKEERHLAQSQPLMQGLPQNLEIHIKSFETIKWNESELQLQSEALSPLQRKYIHERFFWNAIVSDRIKHYGGAKHVRVAEGLMLLGHAHLNCEEYVDALKVYRSAVRIFRKLRGDAHLTVARSLDKVGLVCCRLLDTEHLTLALHALGEAFAIRYETLGPIHIDTVDTLNNMAGVYWHRREYEQAREAYWEVYAVRQILFGPRHPSVAVTAHALGSVHLNLAELQDASRYYVQALEIYKGMRLTMENPALQKLVRDMATLARVTRSAVGVER